MKKIMLGAVVTMFTLSSLQLTAQIKKGAYVGVNVGYNAGAAVQGGLENRTSTGTTTVRELVKFSYGKGINAGLNLGYMVNENIGFELGLGYLIGGKTKATEKYTGGQTDFSTSAAAIQIKPTIVLATTIDKVSPYAKFGLVIGSTTIKSTSEDKYGSNIDITKTTTKGGMAIGFNSAMGILFPVNSKLSISAEVNMINMQYSPKKSSVTLYTENGVDKLNTWTIRDKETEFVKSITAPTTGGSGVPTQSLSTPVAFGSIGINVGIKYSF
jgi:outer membrane protein W